MHFQTVYKRQIWCLCTVTFGKTSSKLNSRPVYCSQLYGCSWHDGKPARVAWAVPGLALKSVVKWACCQLETLRCFFFSTLSQFFPLFSNHFYELTILKWKFGIQVIKKPTSNLILITLVFVRTFQHQLATTIWVDWSIQRAAPFYKRSLLTRFCLECKITNLLGFLT